MNVHLLTHLAHYVRLYGPLWTHSAFPFEDFMGNLLSNSHGTHAIEKQVLLAIHSYSDVTFNYAL